MYDPGVLRDYFHDRLQCAGEQLASEILVKRFGRAPADIAEEMRHRHDLELLETWALAANAAESLDAFRHYILHTAPATN